MVSSSVQQFKEHKKKNEENKIVMNIKEKTVLFTYMIFIEQITRICFFHSFTRYPVGINVGALVDFFMKMHSENWQWKKRKEEKKKRIEDNISVSKTYAVPHNTEGFFFLLLFINLSIMCGLRNIIINQWKEREKKLKRIFHSSHRCIHLDCNYDIFANFFFRLHARNSFVSGAYFQIMHPIMIMLLIYPLDTGNFSFFLKRNKIESQNNNFYLKYFLLR